MSRLLLSMLLASLAVACGGDDGSTNQHIDLSEPLAGSWEITWDCIVHCKPGNVNPLAHASAVDISGGTVTYRRDDCADCGATHTGVVVGSCVEVPAADGAPAHEAYRLCRGPGADEINTTIVWSGYPGPTAPRTWSLVGTP